MAKYTLSIAWSFSIGYKSMKKIYLYWLCFFSVAAPHFIVLILVFVLGRSWQERPLEPRVFELLDALLRQLAPLPLLTQLVLLTLRLEGGLNNI